MPTYTIRHSEGVEDITCRSKEELSRSLLTLAGQLVDAPTLVELNDGAGRFALVGVGLPVSSLEVSDAATGAKRRALSPMHGDVEERWEPGMPAEEQADVWFSYLGGEATLVTPRFLLPTTLALSAAVDWIVYGKLESNFNWLR